ncbi:hydroxymethylglutaryl-CoA synthase family protein [Streptomyces sp. NPDC001139]
MTRTEIGLEALNVYCGLAQIPVADLFAGRGLDTGRLGNLMMNRRSVQLPFEDAVTNAVNAAKPMVDALSPQEQDSIELLVTSTESGLDFSKSVASYVHAHLGLSRRCRIMEVKQACYGATGMLQLAAGYLAATRTPRGPQDGVGKALVIATDVTVVTGEQQYAEPATGHGAAALLVGGQPQIMTFAPGQSGLCSFETMDTARPTPTFDLWDTDRSLLTYMECLTESYRDFLSRHPSTDLATSFDQLAFHTPFAGIVKAGHRRLMRQFAPRSPQGIEEDFTARVVPSLVYPQEVGNMFSGSLYLALCSIIDNSPVGTGSRVGLYSYGSGCASEFFSGSLLPGARETMRRMRIAGRLAERYELTFGEYRQLLDRTHTCLVPEPEREVDLSEYQKMVGSTPILALSSVRNYHRRYEWLSS